MTQNSPSAQIVTSNDDAIALLQGSDHFDALVSGVADYAIFLLSREGNIISWNAGAQQIKGYRPEEIIGKHFSVFYTAEAQKRDLPGHILQTAAEAGRCVDEGWRVRNDGSRFWASVVVTALRAQNGALRGFLKITRDLTEHRKVEALEIAYRQKDEFFAAASHELRTHLNAMLGWLGLMRDSKNDESTISKGIEVLHRNTETLANLISRFLDISRITTGTLTLKFEEVDWKEIVRLSVETFQAQAASKGIALNSVVEIPENVACRVWADELALRQISDNILSNALKFTPEGGTVTVELMKDQTTAILVIKDTGIGMSPDFIPRAFEQFAQADESPRGTRGLGLGLAICKHLVERQNGSISAESEGLGRGTTFQVKLPLTASNFPVSSELCKEDNFVRGSDNRLSTIKVVAVDDDADTRELLDTILKHSDADATVVGSGEEALEAIKNVRPDVLICDLAMPEMDGYELLENVRRLEPEVRSLVSIAFTASARSKERIRSRRAGFQAHLVKPVIADELVKTIVKLVKPESSKESGT